VPRNEDEIIGFSTDNIKALVPLAAASRKELGGIEATTHRDLCVLEAGVWEDHETIKTRGFRARTLRPMLRRLQQQRQSQDDYAEISVGDRKLITIKTAARQVRHRSHVGRILSVRRRIIWASPDEKRVWFDNDYSIPVENATPRTLSAPYYPSRPMLELERVEAECVLA
jgi:hypothetical protein